MRPLPASRTRVLLNLPVAIPLFKMQHRCDNKMIRSFLEDTLNARLSMLVQTITTDSFRPVQDMKYQELQVHFYVSSIDTPSNTTTEAATTPEPIGVMKKTLFVVMPRHWTPQTYAVVINMTLKKTSFLTVETVQINGCSYLTINDVDHYFSLSKQIYKKLVDSSAYLGIRGGGGYGELYW